MVEGGVDAVLVETAQDLLQAKAAVIGAKRAIAAAGDDLPVLVQVTVETTGTMLLGSEIGAALTALEALGIDGIGLNCATGPAEMSEHLRHLARHARVPVSCMPNAGLPELTRDGARYPLSPGELADAHDTFAREFGLGLVGGCCGTTPEHLRLVVERVRGPGRHAPPPAPRGRGREPLPARPVPAGHRVPVDRRADERQRLEGVPRRDARRALGRVRRHRPGPDPGRRTPARRLHRLRRARRSRRHASRWSAGSPRPRRCRSSSTRPSRPCSRPGLELVGGRAVVNSVNFEDGEGPGSRFRRIMPLVREHGAAVVALTIDETGQARTRRAQGRGRLPAHRHPDPAVGDARRGHRRRLPHLPHRHRAGGDPPRRPSRPSRRSARSSAATRTSRRRSASRTSPSGSTPRRGRCSTPSSSTRRSRRGWTPRSSTRRRSCRCRGSPRTSARSPSTSSTTGGVRDADGRVTYDPCPGGPRRVRGRRRRRRCAPTGPPSWRRCRSASGSSGASSTARARASPRTWTPRSPRVAARWTSSTTTSSPGCGSSATCSAAARCSCRSSCSPPK